MPLRPASPRFCPLGTNTYLKILIRSEIFHLKAETCSLIIAKKKPQPEAYSFLIEELQPVSVPEHHCGLFKPTKEYTPQEAPHGLTPATIYYKKCGVEKCRFYRYRR